MLAALSLAAISRCWQRLRHRRRQLFGGRPRPALERGDRDAGAVAQGQDRRARLGHVVGKGVRQRLAGRQRRQQQTRRRPRRQFGRRRSSSQQQHAGGEQAEEAECGEQDQIGHDRAENRKAPGRSSWCKPDTWYRERSRAWLRIGTLSRIAGDGVVSAGRVRACSRSGLTSRRARWRRARGHRAVSPRRQARR